MKHLGWALKNAGGTLQIVDQQREKACGTFKLSGESELVQVILGKC